ncbi:MAG: hypothetical protein PHV20_13980 [Bacteroidales bacterium]|nr:hypothetical protein [Bacteroidales bacterium]
MKTNNKFFKIVLTLVFILISGPTWSATETLSCTAGTIAGTTMTFNTANFTFVHAKATDTNFASYTPWRVYTNNTVTITAGSGVSTITSIVIYTASSIYANAINGIISVTGGGSASAVVSGNNCTITITGTATAVVIDPTAQTRWNSIDMNYTAASVSCTPPSFSFASSSVSKLSNDAPFTNVFTTNNASTKAWSSSNEAVATVDATGQVTIHGVGAADIKVNQAADGTFCAVVDATYSLSVTAPVTPEPTNHATSFVATTNTSSEITVLWTDATGGQLPTGYLVKASKSAINAPVDGSAEADASLVMNFSQGAEMAVFTGLSAASNYNFSIWPYTNSGASIDYKTDGVAPTDNAATVTPLLIPVATDATDVTHLSSNNTFTANWQAVVGATGYVLDVSQDVAGATSTEKESFDGVTPNGNLIGSATYQSGWYVLSQSATRQIYTSTGNYGTAAPSFAFTTTGDYIQTKIYPSPITSISFWAKQQTGSTSSTSILGFNGSTWATIAILSNADAATAGIKTYDLVALGYVDITQILLTYTKVAGNLSLDDISITYSSAPSIVPISGSPFAISGGNTLSKVLTGLNAGTYYYTVKATDGIFTTESSNEKSVVLDYAVNIDSPINEKIYVVNGQLIVSGVSAYNVFNMQGVEVAKVSANHSTKPILLRSGVYIVKTKNDVRKIMVK